MSIKTAILTTHRANNFGAMLQAFSLVTACRELGADATILDYRTPLFEKQYYSPWVRMSRNPIPGLRYAYRWFVHEARSRRLFEEFRSNLPLSNPILSRSRLNEIDNEYDIFVVGSDQIWRPSQTAVNPLDFDRTYLLDFVRNGKKCAYAPSIGSKEISPASLIDEYVKALRTFDVITLREQAGADFISSLIGRQVEAVLDPVLLRDATSWRLFASDLDTPKEKYVIVYNVQHYRKDSCCLTESAYDYAKKEGYKVVDLFVPSASSLWTKSSLSTGPAQFVDLIDRAEAVFTNSFHASAFSVIFGKLLFLHHSESKGTSNSRFDTLLRFANIQKEEREAFKCGDLLFSVDCSKSDYTQLATRREHCRKILQHIIKGGGE